MKILIVDDDPNILRLYKEELEEEGYTIVTASNGQEAIERFDQEDPTLSPLIYSSLILTASSY